MFDRKTRRELEGERQCNDIVYCETQEIKDQNRFANSSATDAWCVEASALEEE